MKNDSEILNVLVKLPRLDCGHCNYQTCNELAEVIVEGKAKVSDCWILQQEQNVVVKINGEKMDLHPFVQDTIRNIVLSILGSLKHVNAKGDEYLLINIQKKSEGKIKDRKN